MDMIRRDTKLREYRREKLYSTDDCSRKSHCVDIANINWSVWKTRISTVTWMTHSFSRSNLSRPIQ